MDGSRTITLLGIAAGKGARQPGAEDGPYALRESGLVARLAARGLAVEDLGDIPGVYETRFARLSTERIHHLRHILQVNRHTHACVLGTRRKSPAAFLLAIGGDHSLAIGTLAGLSDSCRRLGVLWIDAHGDFNTPESSPSGQAHGMSLATACGYGHPELRWIADRDPLVQEEDVYVLGVRDLDPPEAELLARSRVHVLSTVELRSRGVVRTVLDACRALADRCDHVHVSFDIDVIDPAFAPATGTPAPDGLTAGEARELLAALGQQGFIGSAEFVEYNPQLDAGGLTGALMLELIEALVLPARAS